VRAARAVLLASFNVTLFVGARSGGVAAGADYEEYLGVDIGDGGEGGIVAVEETFGVSGLGEKEEGGELHLTGVGE
jgi:hypothetical protein